MAGLLTLDAKVSGAERVGFTGENSNDSNASLSSDNNTFEFNKQKDKTPYVTDPNSATAYTNPFGFINNPNSSTSAAYDA